jgi:RNA-directed DNA polymerase
MGAAMKGKSQKRVSLRGSALFKITSPARLARALCISPERLVYLLSNPAANYSVWQHKATGRTIEEPKAVLKAVHARVAWLLGQIETPDYLHSGVKKRSYITNAAQHSVEGGGIKLDIQKFFPSARAAAVCHFFHDVMEYPMDVASRMTALLTFDGHLPTGGNASCILSFWAYKPMFDEIAALAEANGCAFTLYVDDMTMTGQFATRAMQQEARRIIGGYRLRAHKNKVFSPRQPRIVTGVAVTTRGHEVPNRRAKAIADVAAQVNAAATRSEKLRLLPQLVGRVSEAAEVDPQWDGRKAAAVAMRRSIRQPQSPA